VIIAFHREPDFQYINELNVGGTITIENRACQTFVYRVTQRWDWRRRRSRSWPRPLATS